jgi:hypothetical protein
MVRGLLAAFGAVTLLSAGAVVNAHADEAVILVCRILMPPPGPQPLPPAQLEVAGCQASPGAGVTCPAEGTSCAEALSALLTPPAFQLQGQASTGFDGMLYTVVRPGGTP